MNFGTQQKFTNTRGMPNNMGKLFSKFVIKQEQLSPLESQELAFQAIVEGEFDTLKYLVKNGYVRADLIIDRGRNINTGFLHEPLYEVSLITWIAANDKLCFRKAINMIEYLRSHGASLTALERIDLPYLGSDGRITYKRVQKTVIANSMLLAAAKNNLPLLKYFGRRVTFFDMPSSQFKLETYSEEVSDYLKKLFVELMEEQLG